jgi:uncharacterized SAM-binding protein YcdF (DUF218 family)
MMFLLKKIISLFFMPVPLCLLLTLLGLFCLWFTRKQKTGKVFVTVATLFLGLLSYGAVSDMLARPLERKYPPITHFEALKELKWIVVLSGGASVDPELPLSTYLSGACLSRLSEGCYIHNRLPGTKLILTGRNGFEGIMPMVEVMRHVAVEWGVGPEDIVLETKAMDTKDHPIYVKEIVGKDKFILVTSASHMPRAMALFRKHGMDPIPAPTDYMVKKRDGGLRPGAFFPGAGSLGKAVGAIHEYLGMLWAKLRSQM